MEWLSPASSVGLHYFFFSPLGFLCECAFETTWIRSFVFKWGPKFRIPNPYLEKDKKPKKSLVLFSMEISWPWELSRFWTWNIIFASIKAYQNFSNHNLQQKQQIFVYMLLSTTQRVCSQHVGAIGVHRYVKKIWQKPWFSKADHSVITPNVMAEVNSSGRTIWSALKHIPYTWECFGLGFSKELSVGWTPLSNLPAVIPSDSLGAELGQKLDPLKKATVRSCPEASICWRRSPPGPFYRWLYREMPQEKWNSAPWWADKCYC